jgi:hypothetical protein
VPGISKLVRYRQIEGYLVPIFRNANWIVAEPDILPHPWSIFLNHHVQLSLHSSLLHYHASPLKVRECRRNDDDTKCQPIPYAIPPGSVTVSRVSLVQPIDKLANHTCLVAFVFQAPHGAFSREFATLSSFE